MPQLFKPVLPVLSPTVVFWVPLLSAQHTKPAVASAAGFYLPFCQLCEASSRGCWSRWLHPSCTCLASMSWRWGGPSLGLGLSEGLLLSWGSWSFTLSHIRLRLIGETCTWLGSVNPVLLPWPASHTLRARWSVAPCSGVDHRWPAALRTPRGTKDNWEIGTFNVTFLSTFLHTYSHYSYYKTKLARLVKKAKLSSLCISALRGQDLL